MAEQAINTIYLLGEQPDALCTTLIRDFTMKVFGPKPEASPPPAPPPAEDGMEVDPPADAEPKADDEPQPKANDGDSFHLSQLLFIVGHIAIKHIVYLELVERDLKRRKEGVSKGGIVFILILHEC